MGRSSNQPQSSDLHEKSGMQAIQQEILASLEKHAPLQHHYLSRLVGAVKSGQPEKLQQNELLLRLLQHLAANDEGMLAIAMVYQVAIFKQTKDVEALLEDSSNHAFVLKLYTYLRGFLGEISLRKKISDYLLASTLEKAENASSVTNLEMLCATLTQLSSNDNTLDLKWRLVKLATLGLQYPDDREVGFDFDAMNITAEKVVPAVLSYLSNAEQGTELKQRLVDDLIIFFAHNSRYVREYAELAMQNALPMFSDSVDDVTLLQQFTNSVIPFVKDNSPREILENSGKTIKAALASLVKNKTAGALKVKLVRIVINNLSSNNMYARHTALAMVSTALACVADIDNAQSLERQLVEGVVSGLSDEEGQVPYRSDYYVMIGKYYALKSVPEVLTNYLYTGDNSEPYQQLILESINLLSDENSVTRRYARQAVTGVISCLANHDEKQALLKTKLVEALIDRLWKEFGEAWDEIFNLIGAVLHQWPNSTSNIKFKRQFATAVTRGMGSENHDDSQRIRENAVKLAPVIFTQLSGLQADLVLKQQLVAGLLNVLGLEDDKSKDLEDSIFAVFEYFPSNRSGFAFKRQITEGIVKHLFFKSGTVNLSALRVMRNTGVLNTENDVELWQKFIRALQVGLTAKGFTFNYTRQVALSGIPTVLTYLKKKDTHHELGMQFVAEIIKVIRHDEILPVIGKAMGLAPAVLSYMAGQETYQEQAQLLGRSITDGLKAKYGMIRGNAIGAVPAALTYLSDSEDNVTLKRKLVRDVLYKLMKREGDELVAGKVFKKITKVLDREANQRLKSFVVQDYIASLSSYDLDRIEILPTILVWLSKLGEDDNLKQQLLQACVGNSHYFDICQWLNVIKTKPVLQEYLSNTEVELACKQLLVEKVIKGLGKGQPDYFALKAAPIIYARLSNTDADLYFKRELVQSLIQCLAWKATKEYAGVDKNGIQEQVQSCLFTIYRITGYKENFLESYEPEVDKKAMPIQASVVAAFGEYIHRAAKLNAAATKLSDWWKHDLNVVLKRRATLRLCQSKTDVSTMQCRQADNQKAKKAAARVVNARLWWSRRTAPR